MRNSSLPASTAFLKTVWSAAILALLLACSTPVRAVDSITLEVGTDAYGDGWFSAEFYRAALGWDWGARWFTEGAAYLSGHWEVGLGYIEGRSEGNGDDGVIWGGVTGIFRIAGHQPLGAVSPFLEFGLGAQILSTSRIGGRNVSTDFHFSPMGGVGFRFGNDQRFELGYRYWHLSNANIKEPNPGLDFHVGQFTYYF